MMYGLMIEQWEDERALYVERSDEMQRNDEYGPEWQALNIRIAMIDEFLAFLKRCAAARRNTKRQRPMTSRF